MSLTKTLTVDFVLKSLELVYSDKDGASTSELHPICNIVSVTGQPHIGFAVRDLITNQRAHRYPHDDMLKIVLETNGTHQNDISFEINQVSNQPGWTNDVAGVQQAIDDINFWISQCNDPSAAVAGGATEATLLQILAATDNTKDFEMKLIKDTGAADIIVKEIKSLDQDTQVFTTTYEDASGAVYVPVGPLVYMDPEAVLSLVLAELISDTLTHNSVISSGSSNVPAGSRRGSVFNNGAVSGTWNGISLPAGVRMPWGPVGKNDTFNVINFDASGTTFIIEFDN